ncbi:polyamine ABC transporter ATP-binding protein [Acuticoccus sediminis]|uniref:Spermidine/putrescine import ATP-binding protein PotA n=1 Tax=Acuticoccus sediminis TaxID=2184697 RepID=A0A8B2NLT7_9HYPH|nr:ABC transporter ATP-binding protein [Acuticoccus sediminis]RAH97334.1 polyamine ABC transporter ATP-binding protein [Acuticoccus sediminis]
MRSEPLVLEGVTKSYGGVLAADRVDLSIGAGEFLTLLGPSGSGKTTILMAVAGFVEPTAGRILLGGRDLTRTAAEDRNFGMVFQGYALFPHMTVAENVAFPLRVRRVPKAARQDKVVRALDLVQLGQLADRKPAQLSGGQQQRVALARALVFEPHLLLLDEPLSALDKNLRADLQAELKELHARVGLTFLYVTHDQEEALSMSERIAIMRDGRIVQVDAPRTIYARPRTRFVAGFLGRSNFLEARVTSVSPTTLTVDVGGVPGEAVAGPGVGVGDEVLLAVRPERLSIGPSGSGGLPGVVRDVTFQGAQSLVTIETAAAGPLVGTLGAVAAESGPAPGDTVWARWDAEGTTVITAD